jgi:uncharacterized protein DUF6295
MCSYITEKAAVSGSGKGPAGWFQLSHVTVYLDHPYFTSLEHTLNIDFINESAGPAARVAVELSPDSARALVARIQAVLEADPREACRRQIGSPSEGMPEAPLGAKSSTT